MNAAPACPSSLLQEAVDFALQHETPWPRDPAAAPAPGQQPFGVHHGDLEPFNRLRGPLHVRGGPAGVVWQHGRELVAWGEPDRADQTFSVAKTCLALLAGVAHARGLLREVHEPVARRVPGIGFDAGPNAEVTWHHLLQQTSEWGGTCFGLPDQVDRWRHVANDPRPPAGVKGGPRPLQPPGTYWEYNDVRINQLSLALLHLFGRPLPEVFDQMLMRPLGATSAWRWEGYDDAWATVGGRSLPSVPGGTHWGAGLAIGARDQARLGQLLLDEGRFVAPGGESRALLGADWVRWMRRPCDIAPFYGYLVWLNVTGSLYPAASPEAFAMLGAGGHVVLIEPRLQAVIVARWLAPEATAEFVQKMTAALRETAR